MLIQGVLNVIPFYWMIIAKIPKGVLNSLRKLFFRFLWKGKLDKDLRWSS